MCTPSNYFVEHFNEGGREQEQGEAEARQSGKMFVFFETPDVFIGSGCGAKEALVLVSIKYKFFYSPACFSFYRLRPWSTLAVYAFNLALVLFFSGKRRDTFVITIYLTMVTWKTRWNECNGIFEVAGVFFLQNKTLKSKVVQNLKNKIKLFKSDSIFNRQLIHVQVVW